MENCLMEFHISSDYFCLFTKRVSIPDFSLSAFEVLKRQSKGSRPEMIPASRYIAYARTLSPALLRFSMPVSCRFIFMWHVKTLPRDRLTEKRRGTSSHLLAAKYRIISSLIAKDVKLSYTLLLGVTAIFLGRGHVGNIEMAPSSVSLLAGETRISVWKCWHFFSQGISRESFSTDVYEIHLLAWILFFTTNPFMFFGEMDLFPCNFGSEVQED